MWLLDGLFVALEVNCFYFSGELYEYMRQIVIFVTGMPIPKEQRE